MESTRAGLMGAAAHSCAVLIALFMSYVDNGAYIQAAWLPFFAVDFPASFFLGLDLIQMSEIYTAQKIVFWALWYGIVGGAWWFAIAWLVATAMSRMAVASARARFVAGLVTTAAIVILILVMQFFATVSNLAWDGCAVTGFPILFFRDCYWTGMTVSTVALAIDAVVWLAAAFAFAHYLRCRTKSRL